MKMHIFSFSPEAKQLCQAVVELARIVIDYMNSCEPSDRRHGTLAKNHGRSLASLAKILP